MVDEVVGPIMSEILKLSPREFEEYVAYEVLPCLGYTDIDLTTESCDSGYDISAKQHGELVLFECKRYSLDRPVSTREVRILSDACSRLKAERAVFVTTSRYTRGVFEEQADRPFEIEFWTGDDLISKVNTPEILQRTSQRAAKKGKKTYQCVQCGRAFRANLYHCPFDSGKLLDTDLLVDKGHKWYHSPIIGDLLPFLIMIVMAIITILGHFIG